MCLDFEDMVECAICAACCYCCMSMCKDSRPGPAQQPVVIQNQPQPYYGPGGAQQMPYNQGPSPPGFYPAQSPGGPYPPQYPNQQYPGAYPQQQFPQQFSQQMPPPQYQQQAPYYPNAPPKY